MSGRAGVFLLRTPADRTARLGEAVDRIGDPALWVKVVASTASRLGFYGSIVDQCIWEAGAHVGNGPSF